MNNNTPNKKRITERIAEDMQRLLELQIIELGNFMMSLGVTEENQKDYVVETQKSLFIDEGKIIYTVYKVSDTERKNPLGSKTI